VPSAYCTTCHSQVSLTPDGSCPEGHPVIRRKGGKHRAPSNSWLARIAAPASIRRVPAPTHRAPRSDPPVGLRPVQDSNPTPVRKPAAQTAPHAPSQPPLIRYDSTLTEMFGFAEERTVATTTTAVLPEPEPIVPRLQEFRRPSDKAGDTTTLVTRLWEATETSPPIEDWKPDRLDPLVVSGRTFRWPIIIAAVALLIGGLAIIQALQDMPDRAARDARATYLAAMTDYQTSVPDIEDTISVITDPTTDTATLSDAAVSLSAFNDGARNLFDAAAEPLPSMPPFVSRTQLDALTPLRQSMANAAEIGLTLERRLGDTLSYRLLLAKTFQLPALPTTATQDQLTQLGVTLGLAVTSTKDAIGNLPDEPFLSDHKSAAFQLAQRLDDWQVEYLDALRTGDTATAETLVQEITQRIDALNAGIDAPLAAIGEWARTQLDTLQRQLTTATDQTA
jgi:hypothetical protein